MLYCSVRLAYSFAYRFIWDSVRGIYIFQPETACHNYDSLIFKLISSAITAELSVLSYCIQLQFRYSEVRLLKKRAITKMSQRNLPMKSRQTNSETRYTRRPILPEIEFVNLPLVEFHSSISAGAIAPTSFSFKFDSTTVQGVFCSVFCVMLTSFSLKMICIYNLVFAQISL